MIKLIKVTDLSTLIKMVHLRGNVVVEILNASDVKREFGDVLIKAQRGPVYINKNGKPVAVMVSAESYAELLAFREQHLRREIEAGIADIKAGRVAEGSDVIQWLRQRVLDGKV